MIGSIEAFVKKLVDEDFGSDADIARAVAEHYVDEECAAGVYEGCSTDLELAYFEYQGTALRILERME